MRGSGASAVKEGQRVNGGHYQSGHLFLDWSAAAEHQPHSDMTVKKDIGHVKAPWKHVIWQKTLREVMFSSAFSV